MRLSPDEGHAPSPKERARSGRRRYRLSGRMLVLLTLTGAVVGGLLALADLPGYLKANFILASHPETVSASPATTATSPGATPCAATRSSRIGTSPTGWTSTRAGMMTTSSSTTGSIGICRSISGSNNTLPLWCSGLAYWQTTPIPRRPHVHTRLNASSSPALLL